MVDYSQKAYEYINRDFLISDIKRALSGDDDIIKSAAILKLDMIDEEIAKLLVFNLTNQSGPVRELCAYKLSEFMENYNSFFQDINSLNTIIAAINDVNPNVVRFILHTIKFLDNKKYIFDKLINNTEKLKSEILNKPRRGKVQEHIFTKKCFKIYWSLEGIKEIISVDKTIIFKDEKTKKIFLNLLKDLCEIDEYTVREKIAQIVKLMPESEIYDIKNKLGNDKNYFVKRHTGSINENINCG